MNILKPLISLSNCDPKYTVSMCFPVTPHGPSPWQCSCEQRYRCGGQLRSARPSTARVFTDSGRSSPTSRRSEACPMSNS